jgi:hypothetical protein
MLSMTFTHFGRFTKTLGLGLLAAGLGCGGGGSSSTTVASSPPPTPTLAITPNTANVQPGGTQQFTANESVTWTVSCSTIPCGSVSPASGATTTYKPPVTLPAADLKVTLTATSTSGSSQSAKASITVPQISGFAGVNEAHIDSVNGITRLIINGQTAPPLMFMDQENFLERVQYLAPEVQDATARGIHLFQVSLHAWPWDNQGTAPLDFSHIDQVMDNVMAADPKALLLLRVDDSPGPGWKPPVAPTNADYIVSPNVPFSADVAYISLASDIFFNGFLTSVPHLIDHLANSSYGGHVLGYTIMGPPGDGEWYPVQDYYGPDYSPVNTQHFQSWLQKKYGTDAALSTAWGLPVTIATAQVPPPQPGRFPWHEIIGNTSDPLNAFYELPQEQDWVDYSAYTSDLFSQRILDAASLFRTQTGSKRILGLYNGYFLNIPGSYTGHLRFDRLLASPNIDFIAAAISNYDRQAGGAGGLDDPIESTVAHGKFWFMEQDQVTYLSLQSQFPPVVLSGAVTSDLTQTIDVLQRDMAAALIHRAGTWWFDINENGSFDDPAMWSPMSDYGAPLFTQLYANPQPYRSEVALIIDLTSITYQKADVDAVYFQRGLLRTSLAKTGVTYGVWTLNDFLDGTLPPCKVYIFANVNYVTDAELTAIQARLNSEGATAIWQYAPGFLGPSGTDINRASKLTGIQLAQSDGFGISTGVGLLSGYFWGTASNNVFSPRLVVTDASAEVLGRYQLDNQVSTARKKVGNFESVFSGEYGFANGGSWPPDPLRALLQTTGVHIWSTVGDTVHTDGNLLVVHAANVGPDSISLPTGVTATPLAGGTPSTGTLNLNFSRVGETHWFRLSSGL